MTKNKGFTLVELLVVISLIGILVGLTLAIINPVKQRKLAEDGVRQSNLQKLALGVESYANANGNYPSAVALDVNNVPTESEIQNFISKFPNDEPTSGTVYTYDSSDTSSFGVSVPKVGDTTMCLKYHSAWGKIQECLIANCGANTDVNSCL